MKRTIMDVPYKLEEATVADVREELSGKRNYSTVHAQRQVTSNPEAEATLQRQRGLVLPNAEVTTNRLASVGKPLATSGWRPSTNCATENVTA